MTDVFIQCRLNSTRFPKKALKKICNKTIIELIIERCNKISPIKNIIVVTGPEEQNGLLIEELERIDTKYFCGSENNLLDRFYQASKKYNTDNIIRLTADNPLIDISLVNQALNIFNNSKMQIVTNSRVKTFPLGQNFDIFSAEVLEETWHSCYQLSQNKDKFHDTFIHVTENLYKNSQFKIYDFKSEKDYSGFRFSIDYEEDYKLMIEIYDRLYHKDKYFTLKDLLNIIESEPELIEINQNRSNN